MYVGINEEGIGQGLAGLWAKANWTGLTLAVPLAAGQILKCDLRLDKVNRPNAIAASILIGQGGH